MMLARAKWGLSLTDAAMDKGGVSEHTRERAESIRRQCKSELKAAEKERERKKAKELGSNTVQLGEKQFWCRVCKCVMRCRPRAMALHNKKHQAGAPTKICKDERGRRIPAEAFYRPKLDRYSYPRGVRLERVVVPRGNFGARLRRKLAYAKSARALGRFADKLARRAHQALKPKGIK